MNITLIVFAVALLLAVLLLRAARGYAATVRELPELEGLIRPVDLSAFRNLVDPAEEEYLRAQLPNKQFRVIQRRRMRAALDYVGRTRHNGAILLRLGESVRRDPDPEVATTGRQLMDKALQLRMSALIATCILYARIAMPEAPVSIGRIIDIYESLTEGVLRLTQLKHPAYSHRIAAVM